MNIVLLEPEIPQNTGSIARTCAGTDTVLHLVGRLGFSLEDRYLKRAGLDYWPHVKLAVHQDWDSFCTSIGPEAVLRVFSAREGALYTEVRYGRDDYLVFGGEASGFPLWFRERYQHLMLRIPINKNIRSLNLSNAANIVLFEALRQTGFPQEAPIVRS